MRACPTARSRREGRAAGLLAACLLLAACATARAPSPAPAGPDPYAALFPASAAITDPVAAVALVHKTVTPAPGTDACPARVPDAEVGRAMIEAAVREWIAFGGPVLDETEHQPGLLPSEPSRWRLVDPARNPPSGRGVEVLHDLGFMEDDYEVRLRIGGYWTAAPQARSVFGTQGTLWRAYGGTGWAIPWSAAFTSWLACRAGLGMDEFHRDAAHQGYIDPFVMGWQAPSSPFGIQSARAATPRPGDLVCAIRESREDLIARTRRLAAEHGIATQAQWSAVRRSDPFWYPSHCDLVVQTRLYGPGESNPPYRGYVLAIGGNVVNGVTMSVSGLVRDPATGVDRLATGVDDPGGAERPWSAIIHLKPGTDDDLDRSAVLAEYLKAPACYRRFLQWRRPGHGETSLPAVCTAPGAPEEAEPSERSDD